MTTRTIMRTLKAEDRTGPISQLVANQVTAWLSPQQMSTCLKTGSKIFRAVLMLKNFSFITSLIKRNFFPYRTI